jgi:hypothetical protein
VYKYLLKDHSKLEKIANRCQDWFRLCNEDTTWDENTDHKYEDEDESGRDDERENEDSQDNKEDSPEVVQVMIKEEKEFNEEEMEEGRHWTRQVDDYISQNPSEKKWEEWMLRLHPESLKKLLKEEEDSGNFKPRNWTEEEWMKEMDKKLVAYTREDDESEEEYEDEYEDEYELLREEEGYARREDENENEYGDKYLKKWADSKQYEPQKQPESQHHMHEGWFHSHQGDTADDDVISQRLKLERKTAVKMGCDEDMQGVNHEENLTLVNLWKQYPQQLAGQQLYTEFKELQQQESQQQWFQSHQGNTNNGDEKFKILNLQKKTVVNTSFEEKPQKPKSELVETTQETITSMKQPTYFKREGFESSSGEVTRPSTKREDDLSSQEGIKIEVENIPLISTVPSSQTPTILFNHHLKENLDPGLVMISVTPLTPPMVPTTPKTTSQTTLPIRHFKENLNPGLVPTSPTPPTAPTTELNGEETSKRMKEGARIQGVEKPIITNGSKRGWKNRKKTRERVRTKEKKKTQVIKARMVSKMKNDPGQIRLFQDKNTGKERKISTPAFMEGILLGKVKHHTSVNKQTGFAHNLIGHTLTQDTRPNSETCLALCLVSRTTLGRGRPPEA